MNRLLPLLFLLFGCTSFLYKTNKIPDNFDFNTLNQRGVFIIKNIKRIPSKDGVLFMRKIKLPGFKRAVFFSADKLVSWPANANRILPWIIKKDFKKLFEKGYIQNPTVRRPQKKAIFLLVELKDGNSLAILPLAGKETISWIEFKNGLFIASGTLGKEKVETDVPVFAWSKTKDPYTCSREVWDLAINTKETYANTNLRYKKKYPEIFKYLGWCSWEQYKKNINEKILMKVGNSIIESDIPIRWILVDDGHEEVKQGMLLSFMPDKKKFPNGWTNFINLKKKGKIKWLGLWHNFQGYWKGIHPKNKLGDLNKYLMPIKIRNRTSLIPKDDPKSPYAFYYAYIKSVSQFGFDFVKIDAQANNLRRYKGRPNAVRASRNNKIALEEAVKKRLKGMINCMAQNMVCFMNNKYSSITRCSIDYHVGKPNMAKSHLMQSFHNTLWIGQTVWPDHDMFHSSDKFSGLMMAISKALSGGPIYLSDPPRKFNKEFILPLCFNDGKLLRPSAPGVPLPDSIYIDALNEDKPYRVIAPLSNKCAAIAVYNLKIGDDSNEVKGYIKEDDYCYASVMIQPWKGFWQIPKEGLVFYDWIRKQGGKLVKKYDFNLKGFDHKLFIISPIINGWAVIGDPTKFLSPQPIKNIEYYEDKIIFQTYKTKKVVIWSDGKPKGIGFNIKPIGRNLWTIENKKRNKWIIFK